MKHTLVVCLLLVLLVSACRFYFDTTKAQYTINKANTSVEKGRNLAFLVCAGCHYDHATKKFSGLSLNDLPKIAGKLYSANLTQSVNHGLPPKYSDAELFYLLKTGISRSGKFTPYMMRPMMADEDINDIIAFLRSDDPSVAPYDSTVGKTHINWIGRNGIRFATKPQPYQTGIARPNEQDPKAYGQYLVAIIGCYHCHSRKVLGLNYLQPEQSKGYLQGGIKLKDPRGKRLYGPNLTPDTKTGIGNFTKEDLGLALREGKAPGGRELSPPMPRFHEMTDNELNAIYTYLKSLPPTNHKVKGR